jgi:UDP-N-acetylglucosamine 2-epimerase (non-hydrolysing)
MLLDLIAGTRPNFVKLSPIIRAIEGSRASGNDLSYRFIHTGQHQSDEMSAAMLSDLGVPEPNIWLRCEGITRGAMLASVVGAYDAVLQKQRPDWTVVLGDVTSTLGAALAAKSVDVCVAHVEAGLRSRDRSMPEEINRIATDAISDLHFTTSRSAGKNLMREAVEEKTIRFVGNTMADALLHALPTLQRPAIFDKLEVSEQEYVLLTLHRPVNVDEEDALHGWLCAVADASGSRPVVFPVHPRTAARLSNAMLPANIKLIAPLPYLSFLYLQQRACLIVTDSGGVSEEATILNKPCVTLRATTERPETVNQGTNVLAVGIASLERSFNEAFVKMHKTKSLPELWDGQTSQRIVNALLEW